MINEEEKMTEKEKNKSKKKKIINNINVCKSEFLKTLKRIKCIYILNI